MIAPSYRLATHLIVLTTVDDTGQDTDFAMAPNYPTATAYLGVVERSALQDIEGDPGGDRVTSTGAFTVTVFSAADPGLKNQSLASWAKRPVGFPNPATGSSGVVTLPTGWAAERSGVVMGDGAAMDYGAWTADVTVRA